jgi:hypothetical protein
MLLGLCHKCCIATCAKKMSVPNGVRYAHFLCKGQDLNLGSSPVSSTTNCQKTGENNLFSPVFNVYIIHIS